MPKTLLIATKNQGKAREFREMLGSGWKVLTMADLPGRPAVVEDGATFEENAIKKALEVGRMENCLVLADDSGLEVDALGGAPGVYSARFAGEPANDAKNNTLLLRKLMGVQVSRRGAQFRCVLALAKGKKLLHTVEGICRGRILTLPKGSGGFGYDPLFVPNGYSESFAQLGAEAKHQLSHRGKAMAL
ncbi:MAG: RdgB/HAM1 family non-canonical purine NTP pyrophosphatase, partial [Methylacidiphilales bacterium]|nr:RdgB/HAM1 family non-canonical purine NTP pyrophosphatase [Candidatus Methylacidiphilales bacterium]